MENKIVNRESLGEITFDYKETSIEMYENMINTFKEEGATHIDIYVNRFGDESIDSIEFNGIKNSFETDYELKARLEKQENEKNILKSEAERKREQFEKDLLKQLKEKYEYNS